jgi:fluoride exporter
MIGRPGRRELGAIFIGGAAGALLRVWLGRHYTGDAAGWPWVTFSVNVTGSFALGYLATRLQTGPGLSIHSHRLLATGFCGAYTTFSTMQVEILAMIDHQRYGLALAYALASLTAGYLAIWTATALVRRAWAIA